MNAGARPRVAVLYNAPVLPPDHADALAEADVVDVATTVAAALEGHGFAARVCPVSPPIDEALRVLRAAAPDVVFNLIEGFGGSSLGANFVTALIEATGLPFTGSPSESLTWCLAKSRAKALLRGLGLPSAPFAVVEPGETVPDWPGPWPVIVKPDAEDASLGIDQRSVARDADAVSAQVARLRADYGGRVLLEAYLPGPEFNVGLLALPDPVPLPVAEVVFAPRAGDHWPILTYAAKWLSGSAEDLASPVCCPAQIDLALASTLGNLAIGAFRATACRDYARVDFRLDAGNQPMILEVNPNPDIGPAAGWARAVRASGRDYASTLASIARVALARGPGLPLQ